ncbi:MAG: pitrilysin family protein [Armatimonadetes bacterium]|nr:pitrilysin family protein [Armatimonadota bacterium]
MPSLIRNLAAAFGAVTLLTCSAAILAQPDEPRFVRQMEGISEYELRNGLRVLLFPDRSQPTVTVNVTYLVGSRSEGYGETGMAHLLEHLMFKGSARHPKLAPEMTARGAQNNATTWYDRTNYYETLKATDANLEWALDMEADRMVNAFMAKADLDSEMTVVRNEFEMGENDPMGVLSQRVLSTAYLWHNYGKDTIGARSDIENVPIERLRQFYQRHYQPSNAVLLVTGRFVAERALALVQKSFAPIPRPSRVLWPDYTAEPPQDGERTVTLRRAGGVPGVAAAYHVPSGAHRDYASIDVLALILADTPSGRLYKALVATGLAASVGGGAYQMRDPGTLTFSAEIRSEAGLEKARHAMLAALEGLRAAPPTQAEVARGKARLLKEMELRLASSTDVGLELSEWIAMGDWRLIFLHRDRLRAVTRRSVAEVADRYLRRANRTVGLYVPGKRVEQVSIPARPEPETELKGLRPSAAASDGDTFDPTPDAIESHTLRRKAGLVRLAMLPKRTRGRRAHLALTLRFGSQQALQGKQTDATLMGELLLRGAAGRTRQQIEDAQDLLMARMSVSVTGGTLTANVETARERLAGCIRLLAEALRRPSFPPSELKALQQERIATLQQQRDDPDAVATLMLRRFLAPYPAGDVRRQLTVDEALAATRAATPERLRSLHRALLGAQTCSVALVGDFEPDAATQVIARELGEWRTPTTAVRIARPYVDTKPARQERDLADKPSAATFVCQPIRMSDASPDFPALSVAAYILGGGDLDSRLGARIREKEGLSYSVYAYLLAPPEDDSARLTAYAICAPQNLARLKQAAAEELARADRDGFTREEVAKAVGGMLDSREVQRSDDRALAADLSANELIGRTFAWDARYEARLRLLTAAEVTAAYRRVVKADGWSTFVAGDLKAVPGPKNPK